MPKKGRGKRASAPKRQAAPASGAFAALAERDDDSDEDGVVAFAAQKENDDEEEEDTPASMGSTAWLAEQTRLLEMYSSQAKDDAASSSAVMGSALLAKEEEEEEEEEEEGLAPNTSDDVIERQRALLEEMGAKHKGKSSGGSSTDPSPSSPKGDLEEVFAVRRISFQGRKVPTLLQTRDGPCALLAVANGLLLRGTLVLEQDQERISAGSLLSLLSKFVQDLNTRRMKEDANAREGIFAFVGRLPFLLRGLLLNCGFSSCRDFEFTADLGLFDFLGMQLYHAWVAPDVHTLAPTYNALAEQVAICSELQSDLERQGRTPSGDEDEQLARGLCLQQWLDGNRSQSTQDGLRELQRIVQSHEICVLFRNNHFNTLYKSGDDTLCALLTDSAFEEEAAAVWESIELDGSSGHILGPDFRPMVASTGASSEAATVREDLMAIVVAMGFSRAQAEAGLAVTGWTSADEAVDAILEAPSGMPVPKKGSVRQRESSGAGPEACPVCGKVFKSKNGLLDHRSSKGH